MLAVVPKRRVDGGSSFRSLYNYARYELDEETGEVLDRGDPWVSDSVLSADSVAAEMKLVAMQNWRAGDPVFHYVLTWPASDAPTREHWIEAVQQTLKALGLSEHQAFALPHSDTENFHVHVGANRIHPETYRAHAPEWFKYELDKACRQLERTFGWSESRGLYRWDEARGEPVKTEPHLLDAWREQREKEGRTADGKAGKRELYGDRESLESYCKGGPAKAIRALMKERIVDWQRVHQTLQPFGLKVHQSAKGGFTVSNDDGSLHVRASKALRVMFSGKAAQAWRTQHLGPFEGPRPAIWSIEPKATYNAERQAKRDPATRELRKAERKAARDALLDRYRAEKATHQAAMKPAQEKRQKHIESLQGQRAALKAKRAQDRAKVRASSTLSAREKRLAYGLIALQFRQHDEALAVALAKQRATKPEPFLSRDEWVAGEAEKGDAAAISYMRGLHYAEQRKKKRGDLEEAENTIRPAVPADHDPIVAPFGRIVGQFDRASASVVYWLDGQRAFVDRGPRLDLQPGGMSDEAVVAALILARDKFGPQLDVQGSAEFKARVVQLVAQQPQLRGLGFTDPAMRRALVEARAPKASAAEPSMPRGVPAVPAAPSPADAYPDALPPRPDATCVGPVLKIDANYLYQDIGRGETIRHELRQFAGRVPAPGENWRLQYAGGALVKAEQKLGRDRGRGRQ